MNIKKALASALVLALMLSAGSALAVVGQEPLAEGEVTVTGIMPVEGDEGIMPVAPLVPPEGNFFIGGQPVNIHSLNKLAPVLEYGTVAFLEDGRIMLMGVDENGAQYAKLILNLNDSTLILNAVSGDPAALENVREGDVLYAYVSPAMALSMPAQASAELLFVGIPADFVVPTYAEIDNVIVNDDGSVILITNQGVHITVNDETALSPYLSRQFILPEMLLPGQKVLAWYGLIATSYPAQATADKLIAFHTDYTGTINLDSDGVITLNGEALRFDRLAMPYISSGTYLVPFRKVVEALGFTVTWNSEDNSVVVSKDEAVLYSFVSAAHTVQLGDAERYITHALDTFLGITYMSIDDIITLHNLKLVA